MLLASPSLYLCTCLDPSVQAQRLQRAGTAGQGAGVGRRLHQHRGCAARCIELCTSLGWAALQWCLGCALGWLCLVCCQHHSAVRVGVRLTPQPISLHVCRCRRSVDGRAAAGRAQGGGAGGRRRECQPHPGGLFIVSSGSRVMFGAFCVLSPASSQSLPLSTVYPLPPTLQFEGYDVDMEKTCYGASIEGEHTTHLADHCCSASGSRMHLRATAACGTARAAGGTCLLQACH